MNTRFDAIVIGAGHNGLACALDLARAGRKVLVLEARDQVGGAAVTRSFAPGFSVSGCAHFLHALPQSMVQDFGLQSHGLLLAAQALPTHALRPNGPALALHAPGGLSAADAQGYAPFQKRMQGFGALVSHLLHTTPPQLSLTRWGERWTMLRLALRLRLMGKSAMRELLRIGGMNVYDLLDDNLTDAELKGALAFDACLGGEYGPRSPGTVLTWLYRLAGEQGSGSVGLSQVLGGMGAFSDALALACTAQGVQIRNGTAVQSILTREDKACGVRLADGQEIEAAVVVSGTGLKHTLMDLLGAAHLDTGTVRRVRHFRSRGLVAKLHIGLSALPAFSGVDAAALRGRLLISPSMDYLEQAFNPSKYCEIPERPALEISLPTLNDPGLAPEGKHVLSALVQFVPYDLGPDPQAARAQLLKNIFSVLENHAPGLGALVEHCELLTPSDIEREFGLAGGHWHQGALSTDQFFINRPLPLYQQYQSPLPGLWMCGAACHPGGGIMGLAGRHAARAILKNRSAP